MKTLDNLGFIILSILLFTFKICSNGCEEDVVVPDKGYEYLEITYISSPIVYGSEGSIDYRGWAKETDADVYYEIRKLTGCIARSPVKIGTVDTGLVLGTIPIITTAFPSTCQQSGTYVVRVFFTNVNDPPFYDRTTSPDEDFELTGGGYGGSPLQAKVEYDYAEGYDYFDAEDVAEPFDDNIIIMTPNDGEEIIDNDLDIDNLSLDEFDLPALIHAYINSKPNPNPPPATISYRTFSTYRFYLNLNKRIRISNEQEHGFDLGFSNNTAWFPNYQKYSFVLCGNIIEMANLYFNSHHRSIINWTTTHELCHQIANVFGSLHNDHGGDIEECVGRVGEDPIHEATAVQRWLTYPGWSSYRICPHHIQELRSGVNINDNQVSGNQDSDASMYSEKLKMELSKSTFKQYEPIIALFTYRNDTDQPDTIYSLFSSYVDKIKYIIEDEKGNVFSENTNPIALTIFSVPEYVVSGHDSLKISLPINNYGKAFTSNSFRNNFRYFGYFPPGKYKAYGKIEGSNNVNLNNTRTNIVEFEVTGLDERDRLLLELELEKNYEQIINEFPESPFTEHVYVEYLNKKFQIDYKSTYNYSQNEILASYKKFFKKYPNSYYNYNFNSKFLELFFVKLSMNTNNIKPYINALNSEFYGSTFYEYMIKDMNQEKILRITQNEKKHYEKEYNLKKNEKKK